MMIRIIRVLPQILFTALILLAFSGCAGADPASLDATLASRGVAQRGHGPAAATASGTAVHELAAQPSQPASDLTATPTAQPTPSLGVDPGQLKGVKIRFWQPWTGETDGAVRALVEQFNLTNEADVEVEMTSYGSQEGLNQAVRAALEEGQPPDLTAAYLFQALNWPIENGLVDLQPYLADSTWGLSEEEQADFYPGFFEAGLAGNKRPGMPALGSAQVLVYNQSWAEELGFDSPPETAEQLAEQVCAAAKANQLDDNPDNDGKGGLILSTQYSSMLGWIAGFGGEINTRGLSESEAQEYHFATPQVEEAFSYLRDLYDRGCAWLPEEPYPEDGFANRFGLLAANSVANLPYQARRLQQVGNQDRWTVLGFPGSEGGVVSSVYGPAYEVIPSSPERQLAAWIFIRYMLAPENQARLVQAANGLPARKSALAHLGELQAAQANWSAAQQLSTEARGEPSGASWQKVRWALSDAATQLFRAYFTGDKIPELVKFLDKTAAELSAEAR